jgi:hypothetical protein
VPRPPTRIRSHPSVSFCSSALPPNPCWHRSRPPPPHECTVPPDRTKPTSPRIRPYPCRQHRRLRATPSIGYHEAELAGARQALATPLSSGLRGPGAGSRVCKTRPEAHWEPQPKRVGLAGGLIPYVRIGPCAVGLAIFGCAFGRSPANGHLLDAARDHDSDALDGPDCAP